MKVGTQVWALITTVLGIAVIAAAWFLGVSPLLAAQSQAEAARATAASQNASIQSTIAVLKEQKDKIGDYEKRAGELEVAIPSDIESADFIRSLNDLATSTAVTITQISLSDAVSYVPPAATATNDEFAPTPVSDSRITGENFLLVPVTLSVSGGWNEVLAFTHGIQTGNRLMLVTSVSTTADEGTFTTTLAGAMYVLIRPTTPAAPADADSAASADG